MSALTMDQLNKMAARAQADKDQREVAHRVRDALGLPPDWVAEMDDLKARVAKLEGLNDE